MCTKGNKNSELLEFKAITGSYLDLCEVSSGLAALIQARPTLHPPIECLFALINFN